MGGLIRLIVALALIGVLISAGVWWYRHQNSGPVQYRTAQVRRTDVTSTISATGTVVPEDVVDVGAQVNGLIAKFGTDADGHTIDYRSTVTQGMLLAQIDDALFTADLSTSQAQLRQANAQVQVATANRDQARAKLEQARRDWERAQRLGQTAALAQVDYDAAQSAYEQAVAGLAVAEASIAQAQSQVAIAQASVQRSERNLAYTTINSPVDGVIIDKRVEIGQTVVASLNAPSLFLIAKDLRRMEVLVQVNEADIGNVHAEQPVMFTVDAFPGRVFRAQVRKVRLNATMTQNVVTYTVEILTDNTDLRLLPYLTANVKFIVGSHENVLAVPNAALRWSPSTGPAASAATTSPAGTSGSGPAPGRGGGSGRAGNGNVSGAGGIAGGGVAGAASRPVGSGSGRERQAGVIWLLVDGTPQAISVRTGLTDGVLTEIEPLGGAELPEGALVIVGEENPQTRSASTSSTGAGGSPFTPQMPGRGGGRR